MANHNLLRIIGHTTLIVLASLASSSSFASSKGEYHISICAKAGNLAAEKLGFSNDRLTLRSNMYIDTDNLWLHQNGLIFRARMKSNRTADLSLKLRPFYAEDLTNGWLNNKNVSCEWGHSTEGETPSCTLNVRRSPADIRKLLKGEVHPSDLLTATAIKFITDHTNFKIPWKQLRRFGPVAANQWVGSIKENRSDSSHDKKDFALKLQSWSFPNGFDLIDLSFRGPRSQLRKFAKDVHIFVKNMGVKTCSAYNSKTRFTLEYFMHIAEPFPTTNNP